MIALKQPLTAGFEYIFAEDTAIDTEHPDYNAKEYEEGLDPKYLPVKSGEKPTRFICRPLSRESLTKVMAVAGPTGLENTAEAMQLALAYGLKSVTDGPSDLTVKTDRSGDRLDNKTLDALHATFGFSVFIRVGSAIVRRSSLSPF